MVEQWLYDHAANGHFLDDYGHLDLATLFWRDEVVPVEQFIAMPTGPSDEGVLEDFASNPYYWSDTRHHQRVPQHWESHGTWLRRLMLIKRSVLRPSATGLQVIEGRTRVGILRGFLELGRPVAAGHSAWVARLR